MLYSILIDKASIFKSRFKQPFKKIMLTPILSGMIAALFLMIAGMVCRAVQGNSISFIRLWMFLSRVLLA